MKGEKITSFTDFHVWKEGHKLVLQVYRCTSQFPESERFGLVTQLRRAAVSVTSNIVEGFSRRSYKEKERFYYISLGSLTEVQNQLLIARDVSFLAREYFDRLGAQAIVVSRLLNGLIKTTKQRQ